MRRPGKQARADRWATLFELTMATAQDLPNRRKQRLIKRRVLT